ncbi:unnamed protein product [Closterium sp. Yama58-4]|nr:unnamed protein product [Closterium sp. Yama58-4]
MFASLSGSGAGAFTAPGGEIAHGDALRRSASDRGTSAAIHAPAAAWSSALTRAGSCTIDVFSGSPRESFPYTATTHSDRFSHAHYNHIGGNEKPDASNAASSAQGQMVSTSQLFGQSPTTDPRSWHERSNHSKGQDPLLSRHLPSRSSLPGASRFESDRGDATPSAFAKPAAPLPVGQNHHPSGVAPPPISVAGASVETAALHGGQCGGTEVDGGGSAAPNNTSTRGASKKRKPVAQAGSRSVVAADGYFWHKYGQKSVMDRAITRAYFRCARHSMGCMARKTVDVPIATAPAATASTPSTSAAAASLATTADGSIAKPCGAAPSSAAQQPVVSYHGTHNHSAPGPCSLSLPNCAAATASAAAAEGDVHEPVSASPGEEGTVGAAAAVPQRRTDHERRMAVAESAEVAAGSGTGAADAASAVAPLGLTHRLSLNSTLHTQKQVKNKSMAWINLSRNRTKSKSFSDTWKVLQLGPTRPAVAVPTAPNPRSTDLPLPFPLPCVSHTCRSADLRCAPGSSHRPHDESSPLSLPPAQPPLPLASLAESPVAGASQPLQLVRPEPATPVFPFGPFQPLQCTRREGIAYREPVAVTPPSGGAGETCADRGGARENPLDSGLPASQMQLVLVAGDTTSLPPPAEEPSAWPWTWQERLRAVKRRRMDARECGEAAHGEPGETGGAQDWGKLEAEAVEERRRKQRLGILSGMRQMLDSPGFAAARGQKKRRFIVRQGGLKHRVPAMRGTSSASGSGYQSSENTNSEERAAVAAREAGNARAAADAATLAAHDATQLAVGGAAPGVDCNAAAPHHARALGSSVATVCRGGSSTGRNGGRSGGGGRGGEYEVESTQCAAEKAEMAEDGRSLGAREEAAHPSASPCSDADDADRVGEKRKAIEAQTAADGSHVRRRHSHPSRLGNPSAPQTAAAPSAPPAQARHGNAPLSRAPPSVPCTALPFPLLSPDTPHRSRPSYLSRPPLPTPLPFRTTSPLAEPLQLQACAVAAGEEGRASECTGETPGSMLEVPQAQPDMEGSGASGGSGSSGEGSGGEEEDEVESRGGSVRGEIEV